MPAPSAHLSPGNHLIVCGDTPLAYRLIRELTHRYHESVVVIIPGRLQNNGPRIAAISGITVLERAELTSAALREAGVATARAAAMVGWDDLANFHAALRAQELNPELRIVVGADNRRLGDHITGLLRDCTVLSSSQLAGPALVAAALGETAPSHVRVTGQTLYVAGRADVPGDHVLCGLAVTDDPGVAAQLMPPDDVDGEADLVLAVADGTPRDLSVRERHPVLAARTAVRRFAAETVRLTRWARRHPRRALRGFNRVLARNKFAVIFAVLLAVAISGFTLLALAGYDARNVAYLGIMDLTGSALTSTSDHGAEKVAQVLLTADGMALLPVVTALIVGARLTGRIRGEPKPGEGHVIVVGGGEVGVRVLGGLYDLGFHAVLLDQDPNARGVAFARNHRLPVVIGDSCDEKTLRQAGLKGAIALISVTNNDIVNLETALQARAMRGEELRVVLRLFDDDLAGRVQRTVGNVVSRSVSYLAAPTFAAAMLEHKVLRTIAVGRHVLLIADVRVEPGAGIAGLTLAVLERDRLARVLALQSRGELRYDWSPRRSRHLEAGDRVIVLATRAGLSTFLADNRPPVASP
ncbi:MAG TPA: NAD-binding protein [Trebonia sp.]|jgi:Trk K+ transport system NAD-binding subunit|nr:NAD-binding protein [Trebonia sp.]